MNTRSPSGVRIDDRGWGRYVDIPLVCPRNRERYILSNLKITVSETPQGNPEGDIYGKVIESVAETPCRVRVWFTSISPELRTWLSALG